MTNQGVVCLPTFLLLSVRKRHTCRLHVTDPIETHHGYIQRLGDQALDKEEENLLYQSLAIVIVNTFTT